MEKAKDLLEKELFLLYKKTKSRKIRDIIIKKNIDLPLIIVKRYLKKCLKSKDIKDLIAYGYIGLIDAIEKFDADKNLKFCTYANQRILGSILDGIRKEDELPRTVRAKEMLIEKTVWELSKSKGRVITKKEAARFLKIKNLKADEILIQTERQRGKVSIDLPIDENLYIKDTIKAPDSFTPDYIFERNERTRSVFKAINSLSERERKIIKLYFFKDYKYKAIAQRFNITEQAVGQTLYKAKLKIEKSLNEDKNFCLR